MKFLFAALAISLAASAPAGAQTATASATTPASPADRLVALLTAEEGMTRLGTRAFDAGLEQELGADPASKQLYAANPGLKEHVAAQIRPEFLRIMKAALPELRSELAGIVSADMTAGEIADTITFFTSPIGQKLKAQVYDSMAAKPGQDPEEMKQAAMASVMANLTAEDYPALMAFGASPAAQKMQAVNPKIAAASQAWSERLVAANQDRMKALAAKSVADYLAKKK